MDPRGSRWTIYTSTFSSGSPGWKPLHDLGISIVQVALCERNQWPISATSIILADPAKTIIKTCGSTVPLSAVPTLLKIGESQGQTEKAMATPATGHVNSLPACDAKQTHEAWGMGGHGWFLHMLGKTCFHIFQTSIPLQTV